MVKIRFATRNDIPTLANLWVEKMVLIAQADPRVKLAGDALTQWSSAALDWLSDERCIVYIAEQQDSVLGFAIGWIQTAPPGTIPEHIGVITELTLDMHQYQQGLAKALVNELREWFKKREITNIVALVPHRHPMQQAFWRSLGATEWIDLMWIK